MDILFSWSQFVHNALKLDQVSVLEKMIRPVIVYVFLIIGLRLAGKRELAQMNPLDLIVLLTLSNTVQNAIIGNDASITGGVIGAATLLAFNYFLVRGTFNSPRLDRLINGDSVTLIVDGKVQEQHLRQLKISDAELRAVARSQGVKHFEDVDRAMLETSGTISIIGKTPGPELTHLNEINERLARIEKALGVSR